MIDDDGRDDGMASLESFEDELSLESIHWLEGSIYSPPWRDRRMDGTLSDEFGPVTLAQYDHSWTEFGRSYRAIGSGGLWDSEEIKWSTSRGTIASGMRVSRQPVKITRAMQRKDAEAAARYLREHGASLPAREAQAMTLFYSGGRSLPWIARSMGVKESSVKEWQKRFRARLKMRASRSTGSP